jgi:hypothetical protein
MCGKKSTDREGLGEGRAIVVLKLGGRAKVGPHEGVARSCRTKLMGTGKDGFAKRGTKLRNPRCAGNGSEDVVKGALGGRKLGDDVAACSEGHRSHVTQVFMTAEGGAGRRRKENVHVR